MAGHINGNPFVWSRDANAPHIGRYFTARGWIMPGETVLDAGCCTGYGTKLLNQVAGKTIGGDIDEGCIDFANQNKHDHCEFRVLDLGHDEFPDVDVTVALESFEHVDGLEHAIEQMQKHTKRLFVVSVPLRGTSYAYVNEPPSPATEKNDFITDGDCQRIFATNGWKLFYDFHFGEGYFGVYFKKEPERIELW